MSAFKKIKKAFKKLERFYLKDLKSDPARKYIKSLRRVEEGRSLEYRIHNSQPESYAPEEIKALGTAIANLGMNRMSYGAERGNWEFHGYIPIEPSSVDKLEAALAFSRAIQKDCEQEVSRRKAAIKELKKAFKALENTCFKKLKKDSGRSYSKTKEDDWYKSKDGVVTYTISLHSSAETPVPEECVIFATALQRAGLAKALKVDLPGGSNWNATITLPYSPATVSKLVLADETAKRIRADFKKANGEITVNRKRSSIRIPRSIMKEAKASAEKRLNRNALVLNK